MAPPSTSAPRGKPEQASLADSFRRLTAWLKANGGAALLENLGPASKPLPLARLEQKLGFPVPPGLRALWLMHDGQKRAQHGLFGELQFLPVAWVLNERVAVERALARMEDGAWAAAGATAEEQAERRWFPLAKRGARLVLVHGVTGRVFEVAEGTAPLRLVAESVAKWLAAFVEQVEAGAYQVVEQDDATWLERG